MRKEEAIQIVGAEQFSQYDGYGGGFRYTGDCRDRARREADGTVLRALTAMDIPPKYLMDAQIPKDQCAHARARPRAAQEPKKKYLDAQRTKGPKGKNGSIPFVSHPQQT